MAYDERLAERIRDVVHGHPGISERKMFGGLAFLLNGNMAVAAGSKGALMVRVDADDAQGLLGAPGVERMEMGGRRLKGWLLVASEALSDDAELRRWVSHGLDYAAGLDPKEPGTGA